MLETSRNIVLRFGTFQIKSLWISNRIPIESCMFRSNILLLKSNIHKWFNRDLHRIAIWICPSLLVGPSATVSFSQRQRAPLTLHSPVLRYLRGLFLRPRCRGGACFRGSGTTPFQGWAQALPILGMPLLNACTICLSVVTHLGKRHMFYGRCQNGTGAIVPIFWDASICLHAHSNQILLGDQTTWVGSFYRVYHAPALGVAYRFEIFVARMLTRDLFLVANLLSHHVPHWTDYCNLPSSSKPPMSVWAARKRREISIACF